MDTFSFLHSTPSVRRLTSFQRTPLPNHGKIGVSNSPAKLAKAGFMRREDAANESNDEVTCEYCGIVYGEWSGESPFAVHRVLDEHCPFLHTPSPEISNRNHPEVAAARRRLFPDTCGIPTTQAVVDHEDDSYPEVSDSNNCDGSSFDRSDVESDNDSSTSLSSDTDTNSNNSEADVSETEIERESLILTTPQPETVSHSQPAFISVLNAQTDFQFPFLPKVGDASLLFASRRLKTFTDPGCPECVEWAEEGFVYRADTRDVQCVFCAVVLPLHTCDPRQAHADNSFLCPRVLYKDVGNISVQDEELINLKNLRRQLKKKSSNHSYTVRHPQYEEESLRLGTYENWPPFIQIEAADLSACGFFFTGCADKVRCYSCGVGLYRWRHGADPWEQHALHSPTCPHLTARGQHFVERAAHAQVLTEADLPSSDISSTSDSSGVSGALSPPPGALTLDIHAVTAALATSQYTPQQVRHAVLTYFLHTSRYPTKDILLGTLRAADVNFTALCQQREALHQKDTVIHQKDTALQEQYTVNQQTHSELQQTHCELQQHVGIVEQQNQELQCHRAELEVKDEELQCHRAELQTQQAELGRQREELERKAQQMRYQEMQIESLKMQMQALKAGVQAPPSGEAAAAVNPAPPNDSADTPMTCDIRCKVCLSEESNTVFQPCHHVTCCSTCALQLVSCPVCRAPIRDLLPVYFA